MLILNIQKTTLILRDKSSFFGRKSIYIMKFYFMTRIFLSSFDSFIEGIFQAIMIQL